MAENKMLRVHGLGKFFYQWDTGRKLVVNDEKCSQVHFSNDHFEKALVCKVYDEDDLRVVEVPNILLQECASIKAYLNSFDDNGRLTTYCEIFQVIGRSRPEEYVYTETETVSYSYLDKRLDHLEGDGLANAVADYLKENPVMGGGFIASDTEPEDTSVLWVDTDDDEADTLQAAIDEALAQAKASGEFDGKDGKTPVKGEDYFTDTDKQEIAELAAEMVEVPEGSDIELDTTLTSEGMAADAKAVGDALAGKISNKGSDERPYYNGLQLAFLDDVPTDATLEHFIGNALTQYDASIKQHIEGVTNGAWNQVTEYVGTEIGKLEPLTGTTEEITPAQVLEALSQGRMVGLEHNDESFGTIAFAGFYMVDEFVLASGFYSVNDEIFELVLVGLIDTPEWYLTRFDIPTMDDIPTDDHINDLIDTAIDNLEIPEGGGSVESVNGKTGVVELTASDVGAQPKTLVVTITWDEYSTGTASHSHTEIYDHFSAGGDVCILDDLTLYQSAGGDDEGWSFVTMFPNSEQAIITEYIDIYDGKTANRHNITMYVPANVSEFTNDSGYQTAEQVTNAINAALGVIENGTY